MLTHDDIARSLKKKFDREYRAAHGVCLIARYFNPGLGLPSGRAQVFLPDFHLLNREDAAAYPNWGFKQDRDLLRMLRALRDLKKDAAGQLQVWHLGDLFDIWRARGGLGSAAEVDRTAADYYEAMELLRYGPPWGARAELMAGNHDYALFKLSEWKASRYRLIENERLDDGDVMVLHGDLFNWIEKLPEGIRAAAVRFATWHASGQKALYNDQATVLQANAGLPGGDRALGEGRASLIHTNQESGSGDIEATNVIAGDRGRKNLRNKKFFNSGKELAKALRGRGHNVRVIVVAHTHWARLVSGADDTGAPFVLMDCGSWIGRCKLGPDEPWIHSGQIGVMIGNDLRLYQLGRRLV